MVFDNEFLDSTSQFTGELYQQTIHGVHGNAVVSPVSILTALLFLMYGATGKTLTQMKTALKYNNFLELTNTTILGGYDYYIDKSSTINLTCILKFSMDPNVFTWKFDDEIINSDSKRGGITILPENAETQTSILLIDDADLSDSGRYSCEPSNAEKAAIRVHVINEKAKWNSKELSMFNKIYLMKDYSVKPTFKPTKRYDSEVESVDFSENLEASNQINQWVESKTNNKIKDLIKPDFLNADTKLVLVNGLYFKGDWKHPFSSRVTSKKPFFKNEDETVELDFMSQKSSFNYGTFNELDAAAVELPYNNSNVKMMIILPNTKTGLSALESKFNEINLNALSKRMHQHSVRVVIPKFKIEFDVNLEEPLTKLGMERMFSDAAEFGNLLEGPVKVSKIVHKAFIEVHEKGTEAGAATAMGVNKVSLGTHFQADRPFLFALMKDSKLLFVGRKVE